MKRRFILGVFDQEKGLLKAAQLLRDNSIPIFDAFTPFPIHALESIMGLRRSRLPIVCFFAGLAGCVLALGFMIWASAVNWPINVGGKPFNSLPAFIPITFEVTVLVAGLVTTGVFLAVSRLYPGKKIHLFNTRVTDDRFVLAVEQKGSQIDEKKVSELFQSAGAVVVEEQEVSE